GAARGGAEPAGLTGAGVRRPARQRSRRSGRRRPSRAQPRQQREPVRAVPGSSGSPFSGTSTGWLSWHTGSSERSDVAATENSRQLALVAAQAAADKKAIDVVVLDVSEDRKSTRLNSSHV